MRDLLALMFVMSAACASHARSVAMGAATGVKATAAQVDPAFARVLGDQAARGFVNGTIAELWSDRDRQMIALMIDRASDAAARSAMAAMQPAASELQELVDRTVGTALERINRGLSENGAMHEQLAAMSHQLTASAVYGVRDALADSFPECAGMPNWRRCIEGEIHEMSQAAARGVMTGFVTAIRWPIVATIFLGGVLFTLLLGRLLGVSRTHAPEPHHPRQA